MHISNDVIVVKLYGYLTTDQMAEIITLSLALCQFLDWKWENE
jgi:hypothetical protein